jgi:23S rRNA pseudouridine1911/1915/1917 synthase
VEINDLPELEIIYEDNHLLGVIKPFGIPSQPDETKDLSLPEIVKKYIKKKYNKPGEVYLGLLHRLDRPVGGITVFAKTSKAAARMSESFRNHEIKKTYIAVTVQIPQQAERKLTHYLHKLPGKNIIKASPVNFPGAQQSELIYKVISTRGNNALVAVYPITGRQHQIRVQLSSIHCGLLGDVKYASTKPLPDARIALYAYQLEFIHPVTGEKIILTAPWPSGEEWDFVGIKGL